MARPTLRRLEDREVPAGTTVITPGYTFPGTTQFGPDSWVRQMGNAIAGRHAGPEGILRYDFAAGKLFIDGGAEVPTTFAAGSDEYILYVNWESDSANGVPGWAEATAEGLYGTLVRYGLAGPGRDLHFIGHSYGTVVNSETIQRFGYFDAQPVDQMTTLDPHDFYELFLFDPEANIAMPDVHVWSNVIHADNYYNTKGGTPLICPHGRAVTGAANIDLTPLNGFGNGTGAAPHSRVHDWYALTIDPNLVINDNIDRSQWYVGPPTDSGYRYSLIAGDPNRSAYFANATQRVDPSAPPVNPADVGVDPPPRFFNGDFSITMATSGGRLAGYTDRPQITANAARLNATDTSFAHAPVLFPAHATSFAFDYTVATPSATDLLTVAFTADGKSVIYTDAALPDVAKSGQLVLDAANFPGFVQLLGKTVAVSFSLGAAPVGDVRIDNLTLTTRPPPRVDSLTVNGGESQRSRVTSLKVTLDQPVTFVGSPAAAFQLRRQSDSAPVFLDAAVDTTGPGTVVVLSFTGGPVDGNSLADGRYTLTALAGQISAPGGSLDGNADGTGGDDFAFALHRLFGDADGDADVDATDLGAFRLSFGAAAVAFDFDGDGDVDAADFSAFRQRFGTSV